MDELQRITPALAETIAGWARSLPEAVLFGGPDMPWPVPPQRLLDDPERQRVTYVLVDADDRPVAVGSLRPGLEVGVTRVHRILVDPDRRGQGWGRRLMTALLAQAWADPAVRGVELGVYRHNRTATALYRMLGFEVTGGSRTIEVEGERWESQEQRLARPDAADS